MASTVVLGSAGKPDNKAFNFVMSNAAVYCNLVNTVLYILKYSPTN